MTNEKSVGDMPRNICGMLWALTSYVSFRISILDVLHMDVTNEVNVEDMLHYTCMWHILMARFFASLRHLLLSGVVHNQCNPVCQFMLLEVFVKLHCTTCECRLWF